MEGREHNKLMWKEIAVFVPEEESRRGVDEGQSWTSGCDDIMIIHDVNCNLQNKMY